MATLSYAARDGHIARIQASVTHGVTRGAFENMFEQRRAERLRKEARRQEAEDAVDAKVKKHLADRCARLRGGICNERECNWAARHPWEIAEYGPPVCEPRQAFEDLVKAARERLDQEAVVD